MIHYVSHLSFQPKRCGLRLVLLPAFIISHNFEVSKAFLTQHASCRETKRNDHHLLIVKMSQSDSLKSYIGYFQSQLAKVSNCGDDVSALSFIRGLQVSHLLYKYFSKHNVTQMSEVLFRAQLYIQREEAMKTYSNHTAKSGGHRGKSKSPHEAFSHTQDQKRG